MNRMSPTNGIRSGLGEPEKTHFTFTHQLGHGADGFFDRSVGIDAVLIVEIDTIHVQPAQAGLTRRAHIFGFTVNPAKRRFIVIAHDAELCRDDDILAVTLQGAAEQLLVRVRTVHVGRVEESDA